MHELWGGAAYDEADGRLTLDGVDAFTLARSFGTPLLVLSERAVRGQARRYRQAFARPDFPGAEVVYAAKALGLLALCQLVDQEGLGLDVVSGGELYTAQVAGFPAERVVLHGNYKSDRELEEAVRAGVGRIVVDNAEEIERLGAVARRLGRRPEVLVRVAPGVDPHTHRAVATGGDDSKFGFPLSDGQALAAVRRVLADPHLRLRGLHCHIGSQILELEPFRSAALRMVDFMAEVRAATGYLAEELDLGGGLGVRYLPGDRPPAVEEYAAALLDTVAARTGALGLPRPRILVEPGRSVVCEAGVALYAVGAVKRSAAGTIYVHVDGGMGDNPRPALYGARYTALWVRDPARPPQPAERGPARVRIVGRYCESGDVLVEDAELAALPRPGDLIALLSAGAYTYSMASHYNKVPRPAVVLLGDGRARPIARRERYADLLVHELPLDASPRVGPTRTLPAAAGPT